MMPKNAGNPSFSYVKYRGIMHIRVGDAFPLILLEDIPKEKVYTFKKEKVNFI